MGRNRTTTYDQAMPRQFGTLHERMKYLIECARRARLHEHDNDTWQAIFDLENEVRYHPAAHPPHARRVVYRTG